MKRILLILAVALCFGIGNAYAFVIPTIDGKITETGEWDNFIIYGTDIAEADITDNWDISAVYMKIVKGQASGNGFYFRMDTFAKPTFGGGPGSFSEALFQYYIDYDGDGTPERLVDLNSALDPTSRIVGVYSGPPYPGTKLGDDADGTTNTIDTIIEMYVPDTLLSTNIGPDFGLYARLDGTGDEGDDRLPGQGYLHPVPEPTSMLLLGMGLLGAGALRKKVRV